MEKELLDKYFPKSWAATVVKLYDSPEDIAATEKINQHMKKVQHEAKSKFALSAMKARRFIFTR